MTQEEMNILEQMPASVSGVGKETADPSTPTTEVTNKEVTYRTTNESIVVFHSSSKRPIV